MQNVEATAWNAFCFCSAGETDWNREGRLQGHTDTAAQRHRSRPGGSADERLRPHRLDAVVSSDLARAWTTARIVAEGLECR